MATSSLGLIVVTGTNADLGQIQTHGKMKIRKNTNTNTQSSNSNTQQWYACLLSDACFILSIDRYHVVRSGRK